MSIETPQQSTRSAAGAPPVKTSAANSVFAMGGAVPKAGRKKRAARDSAPGTTLKPRLVLLQAISKRAGLWSRDELRAACSALDTKQFSNAIQVSKTGGFIRKAGNSFEITAKGRETLQKGAEAAGAAVKFGRRRMNSDAVSGPAVAPLALASEISPDFRCAIYSDGTFLIEKGANRIELTNAEFQVLHAYSANL